MSALRKYTAPLAVSAVALFLGGAGASYVIFDQKNKIEVDRERHAFRVQLQQLQQQLQNKTQLDRANTPVAASSRPASPPSTRPTAAGLQPFPAYDIMKYGYPGLENIRFRNGHVLSYDNRHKTANWVCEKFTKNHLSQKFGNRKESAFFEDQSIPSLFRAKLSDYKRSGFDRGHLAAAGNHKYNQHSMDDTFSLSNMSPQVGKGFNRDYWAALENYARDLTNTHDNVYVCTGALYLPNHLENGKKYVKYEVIGEGSVAVPTHFFKTMLCEKSNGSVTIEAYILPNEMISDKIPFAKFKVPLQKVEEAVGGFLYPGLLDKYKHVAV
eukprot:CFRG5730T1